MNDWILLLLAATIGGVVSLLGGVYLLYGGKQAARLQRYAVPFAAGALLAASFLDLLPEAFEHGAPHSVTLAALVGFLGFFVLERFLHWFHHHHEHPEGPEASKRFLVIIGDILHNFIDGLAIGAAFLVSPATGMVTTVAIAAHEIPQEIGDFGLLLAKGMSRRKVLWVNLLSVLATVIGAVLVFGLGGVVPISEPLLLAVAAGFFMYIAASDIIPSIHAQVSPRMANMQTLVLLIGVVLVGCTTVIAHSYVGHSEPESSSHHEHESGEHHDEE